MDKTFEKNSNWKGGISRQTGWKMIMKNKKHTEDAKKKISRSKKGQFHTLQTKIKMSFSKRGIKNPMFGKHTSGLKKDQNPMFGKTHSKETRTKMRLARLNY